jgi:hypothetical protein
MYAYQCSAGRLMGMFPNDDEVARYKRWLQSSSHEFNLPSTLKIFPQRLWHIDDWWCKKLLSVGIVASVFALSHNWLHIWNSSSCYQHCILIEMDAVACWRANCETIRTILYLLDFEFQPMSLSSASLSVYLSFCVCLCVCVSLSLWHRSRYLKQGNFFLVDTHVDRNLTLDTGSQEGYVWSKLQNHHIGACGSGINDWICITGKISGCMTWHLFHLANAVLGS